MVLNRIRALFKERVIIMTPGEVFRWPKGRTITAIDSVVLGLPKALFRKDEQIGDIVEADDEMYVAFPPDSENILLFVEPGMSVTINRNSESYLVADDIIPGRIRITEP